MVGRITPSHTRPKDRNLELSSQVLGLDQILTMDILPAIRHPAIRHRTGGQDMLVLFL